MSWELWPEAVLKHFNLMGGFLELKCFLMGGSQNRKNHHTRRQKYLSTPPSNPPAGGGDKIRRGERDSPSGKGGAFSGGGRKLHKKLHKKPHLRCCLKFVS